MNCNGSCCGCPCLSSLFLTISASQLSSLGVINPKQKHCVVPPNAGEAGCSSHSSFPGEGELFLAGNFLLGTE